MDNYEQTKQEALKLVQRYGLTQHELCVLTDVYRKYLGKLTYGRAVDRPPAKEALQKLDKLDQVAIELIEVCKRSHVLFMQAYNLATDIKCIAQRTPITEETVLQLDTE